MTKKSIKSPVFGSLMLLVASGLSCDALASEMVAPTEGILSVPTEFIEKMSIDQNQILGQDPENKGNLLIQSNDIENVDGIREENNQHGASYACW